MIDRLTDRTRVLKEQHCASISFSEVLKMFVPSASKLFYRQENNHGNQSAVDIGWKQSTF